VRRTLSTAVTGSNPVLWQIRISHYSEKARWALDYKGVAHGRRTVPGGFHMPIALGLTGGRNKTFPILQLDGEAIGDSTAIIGALERRWPDPPLYPEDPDERRRALDLEDFFDEELGPPIRLVAWHDVTGDPERLAELVRGDLPPRVRERRAVRTAAALFASAFTGLRYGVKSDDAAERDRAKVVRAIDRLEAELDGGDYLVGERFTVADLTAAALFYPLVLPSEAPQLGDSPEAFERFRAPLKERPGYRWVEDMFRKHRRPVTASAKALA
jgi:glutathione S-transferase